MYQLLSFDQANPVMAGISRGLQQQYQQLMNSRASTQNQYLPQTLAEQLRGMGIGNDLKDVQLQYAPQMTQADLAIKQAQPGLINAQTGETNARIPLYQAQGNLAQQQAKYFPYTTAANFDPVTKMLAGRQFVNNMMGGGQGNPALQSNDGGMTVQPAAAGGANSVPAYLTRAYQQNQQNPAAVAANLPVLPGGLTAQQGQQLLPQMNAPPGQQQPGAQVGLSPQQMQQFGFGNSQGQNGGGSIYDQLYSLQLKNQLSQMGKDPMFGNSRGGQGGTYVDPFTGQKVSTDTGTQTTRDQKAIASIDNVNAYLGKAVDTLPQFQGLTAKSKVGGEGVSNFLFGTDFQGPSQLASGKAAVLSAAEGFINAFGLNATNENVSKAEQIMTPNFGESGNGYKKRVAGQLKDFAEQQQRAADRLGGGINVSPDTYAQAGGGASQPQAQGTPQIQDTKNLAGKTYYKINGQWHE